MKQQIKQRDRAQHWTYRRSRGGDLSVAPNQIIPGDALTILRRLPADCVDCVITSPPYHLLRSYHGGAKEIGTEATVTEYVERIVAVCDELARVLTPTGSLWLNLGDSYSRHLKYGSPAKSLLLAPERILLALSERGWLVRNKAVWSKTNGMPSSVRDRLSSTWEPLYFLVRSQKYHFDLDAIREPHRSSPRPVSANRRTTKYGQPNRLYAGRLAGSNSGLLKARAEGRAGHPKGKNPGDVFRLATASFRGAHFATFPERLIDPPLRASCPEKVCRVCGAPWIRNQAGCKCGGPWRRGRVLDPFMGAGTVAVVASRHDRDWLGIELSSDFIKIASNRIAGAPSSSVKDGQGGGDE